MVNVVQVHLLHECGERGTVKSPMYSIIIAIFGAAVIISSKIPFPEGFETFEYPHQNVLLHVAGFVIIIIAGFVARYETKWWRHVIEGGKTLKPLC